MTEKLTLEYLLKYCNSYLKISYGRFHWDIVRINFNVTKDQLTLRRIPSFFVSVPISDCKLILRPLESLTEEEKEEIDMIQRKFSLRALADDNDETYRKHFQRITDKYREWNIDFETPSLQERGIAVYE